LAPWAPERLAIRAVGRGLLLVMLRRRTGMRLSARRPLEAADVGARGNRGPAPAHRRARAPRRCKHRPRGVWRGPQSVQITAPDGHRPTGWRPRLGASVEASLLRVPARLRELLAGAQQPFRLPGPLLPGILV